MAYQTEVAEKLVREHSKVQFDLERLFIKTYQSSKDAGNPESQEHVLHGAGRRLKLIRRCLSNVFENFPPTTTKRISADSLDEVQISLHAFVMNLYGFFENLAWAYILRHGLLAQVGDRRGVGLFLKSTQKHLPATLKDYLTSPTMETWHKDYLKSYRDALAHRIPLYIPPCTLTPEEGERFNTLEREKFESLVPEKLDRFDEIRKEQASLGSACTFFLHSFDGTDSSKPVQLHPQMLCDAMSVVEFGELYFAHWHESA
jgi:hypothetical protein